MTAPLELDYLPAPPRDRETPIGVIGSGFIMADCHLPAYRKHGLNVVAIASRNPTRAQEVASRHGIAKVHETYQDLLRDPSIHIVDIAVPPDIQIDVVREAVRDGDHLRAILAQKPLGVDYAQAREIVEMCEHAGITLAVNQNMRWDHSVRACKSLLEQGALGEPVLATIDMRAIPHWMPWQERQGWVTLRIMSIHHLDTFRYWLGDPKRVFASVRPDPRTAERFDHTDGICLYILEFESGARASSWDDVWAGPAREGAAEDNRILWRVEGTRGMARGTIGWPKYPKRSPSTIDYTLASASGDPAQEPVWHKPRWRQAWFPDAFIGPMAELLNALSEGRPPTNHGRDNLKTMALVDACYRSAEEHRAVALEELLT